MTRRYRSKAKLKSYARRISFIAILLSVVFVFTWPYLRSAFLRVTIPVGRGTSGTLEERISGEAVFAGGVAQVTAPAPGTLRLLAADGESVRVGQVIAEVGNQSTAQAFKDSLEFAKGQLAEYETETDSEFVSLSKAVQSVYERAVNLLFNVQKARAAGAFDEASEYEDLLETEEKALRESGTRLSKMEEERARLAANISGIETAQAASVVSILSPASGVFSTAITAVDSKFTRAAVSEKSASELVTLAREAREAKSGLVKDGQKVLTGDVVGRVISGQEVSFYLPVKTEDKPDVKTNRRVDVTLGDGTILSAAITEVIDGRPPGYSIVVGEITVMPVDKVVKVSQIGITAKRQSGTIITRASLLEKDGRQGVLSVQKTYARFQEVEVLMTKGDKAVVRGISETDEIVLKARAFLEGRRVR